MGAVTRKEIMPYVNLTCIRTQKFKTGCFSVNLLTKLSKDTASKNALLPRVLRRGTAMHPDMESIAAALDELYGARIEPVVRKRGEVHSFGFYADFADDDFLPAKEGILEKMADLVGEMLLSPKTWDGRLKPEYVDSERTNLIDEISAEINDKRQYSTRRLIELMCSKEAYGTGRLGTEATARKITAAGLTKYYRQILSQSPIEIIYCGSADEPRVELAMKHAFAGIPRGMIDMDIGTEVYFDRPSQKERSYTDHMDVTQGKLAIGFRLGEVMRAPNYAALIVFNAIFGGGLTSKLFLNVREKLSLCYYASSVIEKHKGIMVVSSGIEFSKYEQTLNEIMAQLDAVRNGDIADWELDSAKKAVMTSYRTIMDQPNSIESYFFDQTVTDLKLMPDDMAVLADCVTVAEVQKVAQSVICDTVYFLAGKEGVEVEE